MNPKTCLVPIEGIYSPADASTRGELTMDSPCPSLPRPTPTPDPPLPPDPSPFPGPPLPEPTPTPDPPLPPDPSPFPGPPITIGQFTACSYLPLKGWSGLVPNCARRTYDAPSKLARFSLKGVAKVALYCAHRTSTVSSCAFCEQEGHLAAPCPPLPLTLVASVLFQWHMES